MHIETVDEVNYEASDIEANCHAGISNPPATITWTISQVDNQQQKQTRRIFFY